MAEALKRTFRKGSVPSIVLWGILSVVAVGGGLGMLIPGIKNGKGALIMLGILLLVVGVFFTVGGFVPQMFPNFD